MSTRRGTRAGWVCLVVVVALLGCGDADEAPLDTSASETPGQAPAAAVADDDTGGGLGGGSVSPPGSGDDPDPDTGATLRAQEEDAEADGGSDGPTGERPAGDGCEEDGGVLMPGADCTDCVDQTVDACGREQRDGEPHPPCQIPADCRAEESDDGNSDEGIVPCPARADSPNCFRPPDPGPCVAVVDVDCRPRSGIAPALPPAEGFDDGGAGEPDGPDAEQPAVEAPPDREVG